MNSSKKNLIVGYALSLLLLLISAVASSVSISKLLSSAELVNHTHEVIKKLDAVVFYVQEGEAGQRGYLLTGDESYLTPYNTAYEKTAATVAEVKSLTADNTLQQAAIPKLKTLIEQRFTVLQNMLNVRKQTGSVQPDALNTGRSLMQNLTELVNEMQQREETLLATRTGSLNKFAASTPLLILVASLLAIIVTVFSFYKVNADFKKRTALQKDLEKQNSEITERIRIIESITSKIASGDYTVRVAESEQENLGVLADSLDKMAVALQDSFENISSNEWQQTGLLELNEIMIGEKNLDALTYNTLEHISVYAKSQTGAFYLVKDDHSLALSAVIALDRSKLKKEISFGEGIAGQSALSEKEVYLDDINETEIVVDFSGGSLRPSAILAVPVLYEQKLKGVIEIGSREPISKVTHDFIKAAAFNIGLAIHSARDHERLQELLGETQAQSEELQSQHSELENVNAELEAQAEKLQASEEELRVQQEELQQANSELEERSRLLEEKNELILERNLDIQRKAEQLELSTKYKSEFLANMSHELRTPLNSILLLSRLLSENHQQNLSKDQVEYAGVIQNSGKSLLTLIDEILDLSKIESGKMELEYSDVSIKDIKADILSLFAPMAKEKNIDFIIEEDQSVPPGIETDRLRLDQILRNLLSNALKFTRQGSVQLHIESRGSNIAFRIKDTGIGIPKEKQQTIFEAFQQADGSTRRQFGGTGLGLSISRELAKLLGGVIELKSEEGAGSEFTLLIPFDRKKAVEEAAAREALAAAEPKEQEPVRTRVSEDEYISDVIPQSIDDDRYSITKNDKCILIIEDDTGFARSLLDYTRSKGYKAIVAVRGDEGLQLAKEFMPQGILLDVQLPVKSGWQVMDELKADPVTRAIPVHIMSSHEVKMKSLSKGAVDFINKPVAFEKLGEMIRKIEKALQKGPKKVLIVEENAMHAQALAFFLQSYNLSAEIKASVDEGIEALNKEDVDCVILDMGIPAQNAYNMLDAVKKTPGMENLPIIVFTGKNLSRPEETKIRQYADSIVVKTAQSYQRILDEVSLFLHIVEENKKEDRSYKKQPALGEVLKGKNILVADDDVRNIFSLTKSLEVYGVNVISATDGREALTLLSENPNIDLVLMDMMMPEMDGYQSTQRIREIPKFKNLPVIAVTAKAMTGDREKCINAGASDYITKPVDTDQLISLLRVWLYNNK